MFPSPNVLNAQEIPIFNIEKLECISTELLWCDFFLNCLFYHLVLIIPSFCLVGEHQEFSQCLLAWPPEG